MTEKKPQSVDAVDQFERLKLGLDHVEANIMLCDADMNVVLTSNGVRRSIGRSSGTARRNDLAIDPDELIGTNLLHYHPQPVQFAPVLLGLDSTCETELRFGAMDVHAVVNPIHDEVGICRGAVVEWSNLTTEPCQSDEPVWQRSQVLEVLDEISSLRLVVSGAGLILDANSVVTERLGHVRDSLINAPIEKLIPCGIAQASIQGLSADEVMHGMQAPLLHADGHPVPFYLVGLINRNGKGDAREIMLIAREHRTANDDPEAIVRSGDGVALLDDAWRLVSVDGQFADILGEESVQLIGCDLQTVMPGLGDIVSKQSGDDWETEYEGRRDNGDEYTVFMCMHLLTDGDVAHRVVTLKDVTNIKMSERCITELAFNDLLTGLANRSYFEQRVKETIGLAERNEQRFAILFFDLDGFKEVNDTLGHDAGDKLLQVIAKRLTGRVRKTDLVCRLGGDEFCILLQDTPGPQDVSRVAGDCLSALSEDTVIAGRTLQPEASVGITMFPDDGTEFAELLRAADTAMYTAKGAGKNRYAFYRPEMTEAAEKLLGLERELREAIRNEDFVVHYQPQVDLMSGHVSGFEALARWQHPQRGIVGPDEFIPVLEKLQLIEELDTLVLREVCRQVKAWQQEGIDGLVVGINIAATHLHNERIVENVREAIADANVDPSVIELELKERAIHHDSNVLPTCESLREIGVQLAIDDFGSGMSCLDTVRRLPVGRLKINRSLVRDLADSPDNAPLIATIFAMARTMGAQLVAEGIEELKQIQHLYSLGCEVGQGFYFGEPTPPENVASIVDQTFLRPPVSQAR